MKFPGKWSCFMALLAGLAGRTALAETVTVDGIKSVVSDQVVTFSEVDMMAQAAMETLHREYATQPDVFRQKAQAVMADSLEQLIDRQLILHSFDTEKYRLPDSVVDNLVQENIRDRFGGDRVAFMKELQQQGMTVEQFRKQVREKFIQTALQRQNVPQIFISPYKVETYYQAHQADFQMKDQVKLRMIVLPKAGADDAGVMPLAREIQAKIKEGSPFAEMASIYSQGSQRQQGGDWGWVERTVLRPELAEAAFALPLNVVSEPVDTPDAVYLMLVEEKRGSHVRPLAEVSEEIQKILLIQEQARLQKTWLDGLKKKTFIRYFN